MRQFIELTAVSKDQRKKKRVIGRLELKETRLVNQFFDAHEHECLELRVKEFDGTKEEFEKMLG
jgi:hypothetical protein